MIRDHVLYGLTMSRPSVDAARTWPGFSGLERGLAFLRERGGFNLGLLLGALQAGLLKPKLESPADA
jgi:hypothetical protein